MWKQFVKDYLRFSRPERRAVLVLLVLILLLFVLPYWWPSHHDSLLAKLPPLPAPGTVADSGRNEKGRKPEDRRAAKTSRYNTDEPPRTPHLFYFDPNTIDTEGWQRLGLRDRTILTIQHFREKGGRFRKPEDISRIYGLRQEEYERLLPYVKIAGTGWPGNRSSSPKGARQPLSPKDNRLLSSGAAYGAYNNPFPPSARYFAPHSIDINTADTTLLIALPGIGSRLANRIIHFREKLGGFCRVEQVRETYALPDSVFLQIKDWLVCDSNAVHRIDINSADVNMLRQHPYIRWNIAQAIVSYRALHGSFKNVDDLLKIEIITTEELQRMRPYLYTP
ncbi:MAG: helix-hairpin-helix domain-containing protein [Bacteroidetes bacterium]|nr:helix-hairpin-helix domain-containing protein [Bacteroidota bacterium]